MFGYVFLHRAHRQASGMIEPQNLEHFIVDSAQPLTVNVSDFLEHSLKVILRKIFSKFNKTKYNKQTENNMIPRKNT